MPDAPEELQTIRPKTRLERATEIERSRRPGQAVFALQRRPRHEVGGAKIRRFLDIARDEMHSVE